GDVRVPQGDDEGHGEHAADGAALRSQYPDAVAAGSPADAGPRARACHDRQSRRRAPDAVDAARAPGEPARGTFRATRSAEPAGLEHAARPPGPDEAPTGADG